MSWIRIRAGASTRAVAVLELAPAAAWARIVAAHLRPVAPHGLHLIAQVAGSRFDVGHVGDELVDRRIEWTDRRFAIEACALLALFVVLRRQVAEDSFERGLYLVVVEFEQVG